LDIKKLKPLNGNIFVIDKKKEEKTDSGIYIPDSAVDDMVCGIVLSSCNRWVSPYGDVVENTTVKNNNEIMYRGVAGAGNCFVEDGEMYRILNRNEILAVIDK